MLKSLSFFALATYNNLKKRRHPELVSGTRKISRMEHP
ncbi:hypothetical protein SAMN05192574_102941 [Mucilaginibacter gossypiicola]|uniref:Uncharacterized protein n=1 Tax=Mucilaginibacter gossypiicola TaxID=551995 RepID=A0A1H8F2Z9_9SPHI|nr:hypothetical protein SAMN05192574_102941 [Mucilaginibacter gossypiicola]